MNIIFVLLDDLGWNDVGIHNSNVQTPNLDDFALNACELTRNYTFSVCGPTRAMIQTGVYAYKYGMQQLISPWNYYGLNSKIRIIPEYLSEIGYSCHAVGKWHLGHNDKKWMPHNRGYKSHYGNLTGCIDHFSHKNCFTKGVQIHDFSENGKPIYPKGHSCDLVTDKAIKIIQENKNNKFFIYLAYNSPHVPLECPEEYKNKYKINEPKKSYFGMITQLDYNLGRIFKELKNLNIFEDTTVWIQSDNGGWALDWACGDNYPLSGGKASFCDGGVRVFTLIKNKEISAKKYDGFCHCVDVLPTLLDLAGYPCAIENIDGISNKISLKNEKEEKRDLILNFYSENFWCFILGYLKFTKEWKKVTCYDLVADPEEKNNIFELKYEQFRRKIEKMINKCSEKYVAFPDFSKENEDEKIIRKKCKNITFWGQKNKKEIKMQSFEKQNVNIHKSFLTLSGYDIF